MKRICACVLVGMLLLSGCTPAMVYETMSDVPVSVTTQPAEILLQLPSDAAMTTVNDGAGNRIYICDNYTIAVQTLYSGDLDATLRAVTGFSRDALTVLQTKSGALQRYECAFSCAGEGQQVGRTVILDDGAYHYAVSILLDAENADALQWQNVLQSVTLSTAQ